MTNFRIDVVRETGAVMLFVEAPCGFKPIIGWAGLEGVREFAEMLMDFYDSRKEGEKVYAVSNELLKQALCNEKHSNNSNINADN